jgi:hypothetical protein
MIHTAGRLNGCRFLRQRGFLLAGASGKNHNAPRQKGQDDQTGFFHAHILQKVPSEAFPKLPFLGKNSCGIIF